MYCPFGRGFFGFKRCVEGKCGLWVELFGPEKDEKGNITKVKRGRCSLAWTPTLMTEVVQTLSFIVKLLNPPKEPK